MTLEEITAKYDEAVTEADLLYAEYKRLSTATGGSYRNAKRIVSNMLDAQLKEVIRLTPILQEAKNGK